MKAIDALKQIEGKKIDEQNIILTKLTKDRINELLQTRGDAVEVKRGIYSELCNWLFAIKARGKLLWMSESMIRRNVFFYINGYYYKKGGKPNE